MAGSTHSLGPGGQPSEAAGSDQWVRSLAATKELSRSARQLLDYIATHVSTASYERAAAVAEAAGVHVSTVTRAAQQLGFQGWPDLQRSLRAHYLARLSLADLSLVHGITDSPFQASLRRDAAALAETMGEIDEGAIARVAATLHRARRIQVTALGSFSAVGQSFVHNLQLLGLPVYPLLDRPVSLSNALSQTGKGDVLVVCTYWRHYRAVVTATLAAKRRGLRVVAIADYVPPDVRDAVDDAIILPAEGTSFFASLTVPMAVQQGIVATLAQQDPERTRARLGEVEQLWEEFELLVDPEQL